MKPPTSRADVRPSRRQRFALVRSWMVHHQGMSLLAIANFLKDGVVQQWFRARCAGASDGVAAAGAARGTRGGQAGEEAARESGEEKAAVGVSE